VEILEKVFEELAVAQEAAKRRLTVLDELKTTVVHRAFVGDL
jgi:hypothetical protein